MHCFSLFKVRTGLTYLQHLIVTFPESNISNWGFSQDQLLRMAQEGQRQFFAIKSADQTFQAKKYLCATSAHYFGDRMVIEASGTSSKPKECQFQFNFLNQNEERGHHTFRLQSLAKDAYICK